STYAHSCHLPSFPTRRSSDLTNRRCHHRRTCLGVQRRANPPRPRSPSLVTTRRRPAAPRRDGTVDVLAGCGQEEVILHFFHFTRSEEHTSELQSQSNLVCRLL